MLGERFQLITAFSREGSSKIYVQHRLREHATEVASQLARGGHFYICGDAARMAQEVHSTLAQIVGQHAGGDEVKGLQILKDMRAAKRYKVSCKTVGLGTSIRCTGTDMMLSRKILGKVWSNGCHLKDVYNTFPFLSVRNTHVVITQPRHLPSFVGCVYADLRIS